jgi:hypothetical protein
MFGAESLLISSPVLWKSWQAECREATENVSLAKLTLRVKKGRFAGYPDNSHLSPGKKRSIRRIGQGRFFTTR